jgi:hypothetical protein
MVGAAVLVVAGAADVACAAVVAGVAVVVGAVVGGTALEAGTLGAPADRPLLQAASTVAAPPARKIRRLVRERGNAVLGAGS